MVQNVDLISWNVRGLNSAVRCNTVHELMRETKCNIVCLQETKLQNMDGSLARFLGGYKLDSFANKPARGTRGGILLLWNGSLIQVQDIHIGRFSISTNVTII